MSGPMVWTPMTVECVASNSKEGALSENRHETKMEVEQSALWSTAVVALRSTDESVEFQALVELQMANYENDRGHWEVLSAI